VWVGGESSWSRVESSLTWVGARSKRHSRSDVARVDVASYHIPSPDRLEESTSSERKAV
jgi:hypothetical protein